MSLDSTVLQNITIILLIIFVAFIFTLLLALIVMRRLINHNTHLMEEMHDEKKLNKEGLEKLENVKEQLNEEQHKRDEMEHELSIVQEKLKSAQLFMGDMTGPHDAVQDSAQALKNDINQVLTTERMTDEQLMAWIDRRFDELGLHTNPDIKLKDIATALGLTQRRILQALKTRTDDNTLAEYLTTKRLNTACHLLMEQPNWKIEAVASEAGFGAITTFRTIFRKHFGISPSQYREKKRLIEGAQIDN